MKHKLTIAAIAIMALLIPATTMAQNKQRVDPDHAKYSIIGTMKVDNGHRYLEDARGKHISFDYFSSRMAKPTPMADLVVRFDSVTTDPYHPMTKLDFWRYDEEIGEWIYDSEVRQGEQQMESTMKTNIMLVIDNSRSLEGDFKKVQDAAIEFVQQLYQESQGKDIFRVGVIGFSTVQFTRVRNITPLDATNYKDIVSFIHSLEMQNGTALYYSLETALNMLESDAQNNIATDEYKESRIYAFTDGLDQASVDDKRNLTTPTEYYDHLRPLMQGPQRKKIMGMPRKIVYSTIVTVRGGDMTDGQERQFDQRAKAICDDVRKLKDMSQLVSEFKKLAQDLVNSNQVLYCFIPVGANGRVGWTFANTIKERKPSKMWMGIGADVVCQSYHYVSDYYSESTTSVYLCLRLDATWPLNDWLSLGGTIGGGMGGEGTNYKIGPLAKFTLSNNSAFLAGFGYVVSEHGGGYFSLGYKFKSPWYLTASIGTGNGISIGVGYSIMGGK